MNQFPEIILASASPRRSELMHLLGFPFSIQSTSIDEDIDSRKKPEQIVMDLARKKGETLVLKEGQLIISADTLVVHPDGKIFGKPENTEHAAKMIESLSGRTHQVYTGVCLRSTQIPSGALVFFEKTDVTFREISAREIESYLRMEETTDLAGAYGIQRKGALFIAGICGDYNNVVGLPLFRLAAELQKLGLPLFPGAMS